MKENKQSIKHIIQNNMFMIKYLYKYTRKFFYLGFLISFLNTISGIFVSVWLFKIITDHIQIGGPFIDIAWYMLFFLALSAALQIFSAYFWEWYVPIINVKLNTAMQSELYNKAIEMDLACYDDPKYFDEYITATSNANSKVFEIYYTATQLASSLFGITLLFSSILILDPMGLIFVAVSLIFRFYTNIKSNKLAFEQDMEGRPVSRKMGYINRIFYLADHAKELRLNNIKEKLYDDYSDSVNKFNVIIKKYAKKYFMFNVFNGGIIGVFTLSGLYPAWLAYRVMVWGMAYGTFGAMFNATFRLERNLSNLVGIMLKFTQHSLYVDKFRTFLNHKMEVSDGQKMLEAPENVSELKLKNVSFKYKDNNNNALHDINMVIKPYQKIALVGYNGAGKTTLAKIIMRLYDPTNGEIEYGGINITDFKLKSYRDCFGSIFQDFILFATTIGENVAMDEVDDCDNEKITDCLNKSGFSDKLSELPKTINTHVYREFDQEGAYFSRGEEQKIAISRVFYKPCHVVMLDEPSSALDPLVEYELNQKMMDAANKKTVIFISHRLSTTRNADKIFMLEDGTIIEEGTHEELMNIKGKYAEMFNMQAEKYRKGSYA